MLLLLIKIISKACKTGWFSLPITGVKSALKYKYLTNKCKFGNHIVHSTPLKNT